MKKILLYFILCLILLMSFVVPAFADYNLLGYKMIGGVTGRYWSYYNPYSLCPAAGSYFTPAYNSVSSWNSTSTPVSFYSTTWDGSTPIQICYVVGDYGSTSWNAGTYLYDINNSLMNPTLGLPYADWSCAIIKINHYNLQNEDDSLSLQSTSAHEMGHALGLAHAYDMDDLMWQDLNRYDIHNTYTPQSDDVNGINDIY